MNTLTKKATVLTTLLTSAVLMTASVKAEQLVSLEQGVNQFVAQQAHHVSEDVERMVARNIQQKIVHFNMDTLYQLDMLSPSVTITDIAHNSNEQVESEKQTSQFLPK